MDRAVLGRPAPLKRVVPRCVSDPLNGPLILASADALACELQLSADG